MKACLNVVHMQQKTYFSDITRHFWNTSLYFQLRWCLTLAWYEIEEENSEEQANKNAPNMKHKIQKSDMQPLNPKL